MYYQMYTISNGLDIYQLLENTEREIVADFKTRLSDIYFEFGVTADLKNPGKILGYTIMPKKYIENEADTTLNCESNINKRLGKILTNFTTGEIFSGIVFIATGNDVIFNQSYGMANRSLKIPNSISTQFNLASMGKMFTAIPIAQLCEKGKLSYEDSISKFLGLIGFRKR